MTTSIECRDLLKTQFQQDFSQKENISQLMTKSRWKDKSECFWYFGSITKINTYLTNIKNNTDQVDTEIKTVVSDIEAIKSQNPQWTTHASAEAVSTTSSSIKDSISDWLNTIWMYILYLVIWVVAITFLINIIKKTLRRWYAFLNNHRMMYLKVLVPRWDSKTDREQAKEIAKDMKEKISRMTQVYLNLHKLWQLSISEKFMYSIFRKPRITMMYHYENGMMSFIVWCYPEYKEIVAWSIGSQYSNSSTEIIKKPKIFKKKRYAIMPLQNEKKSIYTLKLFKKMNDDPINNIIDALGNISKYDTATVMMTIKPLWESWNNKAKKQIDRLYKNLDLMPTWFFAILWRWFKAFIKLIFTWKSPNKQKNADNVTMVRMVKAKEDTLNDMGSEAGTAAFEAWIELITSSDEPSRLSNNITALVSAFNVYTDEYGNELEQLENKAGTMNFIAKPLWTLAAKYSLTNLFYDSNVFTANELAGLFHFPDKTYNRSNVIEWMQYKVLPAPSNLPIFSKESETWFIMSWIVAEKYKKWKLSDILKEYKNHRKI